MKKEDAFPWLNNSRHTEPKAELFEYGIQTEDSDIRAHVSVVNKAIYVFPTANGNRAIAQYRPPLRSAWQNGVVGRTSEGWLVKTDWIKDIRRLHFWSWDKWDQFTDEYKMTTSEKGAVAVKCVIAIMKLGRFPLWIDATEDNRRDTQVNGTDIIMYCQKKIQVKCDWRCGGPLGTGNLYLQKAERNPLKRI